jgi:hypothetical protein
MSGSVQLNRYFSARRNGRSMMNAAIEAGIGIGEARLIENDEVRAAAAEDRAPFAAVDVGSAPPPEPQPIPAPEPAPQPKDEDMARPKKSDTPISGEVPKPDFELAAKIYREDIRPAAGKVGEHAQEMSTAYKDIKKKAHIQPQAARAAFRLVDMEEAKRDDYLRSFNGLLRELKIFMPADLVDAAEGKGTIGETVVPIGESRKPKLATIPPAVAGDTDLADGADNTNVDDEHQHAAE